MLTKNFTIGEFTRSITAKELGINNSPMPVQIERMRWLCAFLLEPIRGHFGRPVRITSGFRCPTLNYEVGGSSGSAHQYLNDKGAADIQVVGIPLQKVFDWIRLESGLLFDLVILERGRQTRHELDDTIHIQMSSSPRRIAKTGATHGHSKYKKADVR